MMDADIKHSLELVERLRNPTSHYNCEDSWYSCPKSSEGCANDSVPKNICTCGADRENALRIEAADWIASHSATQTAEQTRPVEGAPINEAVDRALNRALLRSVEIVDDTATAPAPLTLPEEPMAVTIARNKYEDGFIRTAVNYCDALRAVCQAALERVARADLALEALRVEFIEDGDGNSETIVSGIKQWIARALEAERKLAAAEQRAQENERVISAAKQLQSEHHWSTDISPTHPHYGTGNRLAQALWELDAAAQSAGTGKGK